MFPLYRRKTLVYAVLLLGLVTCIGICTLGDLLAVNHQSVTKRRLAQQDGRVSWLLTDWTGISSRNQKMSVVYTVKNDTIMGIDQSASNPSRKGIKENLKLHFDNSVHESDLVAVRNGGSQMGIITHRTETFLKAQANKLGSIVTTSSVSILRNVMDYSGSQTNRSVMRDIKHQENRVEYDSFEINPVDDYRIEMTQNSMVKRSTSAPFQYYQGNLSDTSFYENQIKVVLETKDACADAGFYDAVMTVHSAPANNQKRLTFRWLYGDQDKTHPYKIKVIFLVGLVINRTLQQELELEHALHHDVVQGNFLDTYHNLTYKAILGFYWVATRCKGLRLLLRLDDDVFMVTDRFFSVWNQQKTNNGSKTVLCDILQNDVVRRSGKWRVPKTVVAESRYRFPHCLGYFAAITPQLVHDVGEVSRRTPFFWIDDVFIYGFVMSKIRGVKFVSAKEWTLRNKYAQFEQCLLVKGSNGCQRWLVIADATSFSKLYYLLHHGNAKVGTSSLSMS